MFFNWNMTGSSYLKMLLLSQTRLLFLFFLSIAMVDVASCNLCRLKQQKIFILKNILIVFSPYSLVSRSYLPFALSGTQDQIWKS